MLDLGCVRPGSTIRIPFSTFKGSDGSSLTMTNYAAADILVYKDGSTTERASTSGFTATTDFDSKTGKHVAIIDLADNTTANFWAAGSEYLVAIDAVTVDAVTTGGWIARFRIGYPSAVLDTTIATLSSQTSFTLTVGPAEDDALNGMWAVIHDISSAVQMAKVLISDYTGSTKTVTLAAGATFTAAAGDNFSVIDLAPLQPATTGRTALVGTAGQLDANVTQLLGTAWLTPGTAGTPDVNTKLVGGQTASASGTVTFPNATLASTTNITAAAGIAVSSIGNDVITAASIANGAIDAATFAADVDAEILSYIVDDATRIDASALNTLSSHDPGATLGTSTLTQTQVTGGAYALNSASFSFNAALDFTTAQKAATLARVTLTDTVTTYTGNTPQTGDSYAIVNSGTHGNAALKTLVDAKASQASVDVVDGIVDSILVDTAELQSDWANGGRLDLILDARASQTSVDDLPTNAELATSQAAADDATLAAIAALNNLSAADVSGAVWNAAVASYGTANTYGDLVETNLDAAISSRMATFSLPTNFSTLSINGSGHIARVTLVDTTTTNTDMRGTDSAATAANLAIAIGYIDTEVAAILEDTGTTIPAQISALNNLSSAQAQTAAAAALTAYDPPTHTELTTALAAADDAVLAAIAALNNLSAAQVNAEVVDALATDTYAEPGQGAPAATTSIAAKINYLFKAWRNKITQTSTETKLFADDGTTVDQKSTVSDDGTTFTRGEMGTGA